MTNMALRYIGGGTRKLWDMDLQFDILRRQCLKTDNRKYIGWWTLDGLGISNKQEVSGMTKKEETIYTTCMILLTINHPRWHPIISSPSLLELPATAIDNEDINVDSGAL